MSVDLKVLAARLLGFGAFAYGVLGLAVGLINRTWKRCRLVCKRSPSGNPGASGAG